MNNEETKEKAKARSKFFADREMSLGILPLHTDNEGRRHFHVVVRRNDLIREYLDTSYSQGCAVKGDPTLEDVLYCLLMDASNVGSFKDWCSDFGCEEDSIKARDMYEACQKTGERLAKMFSQSELEELQELFQDF